jgi:pyridoxine 4-dehydrogenase
MSSIDQIRHVSLGDRTVKRLGYGAMQLAGPGVFGPPKDRDAAIAVLREAVASGVDHIDTSDFYGPHVTNQLIREALHPYPDDLVIVTKIGARAATDKSWNPAFSPAELTQAVHDNLRNLGLDALDVVNLRVMGGIHGPSRGLDRGAAHRARRASAAGAGPSHRAQQRDAEADRRGPRASRRDRLRAEPLQSGASRRRRADRRSRARGHRLCAVLPARRLHAAAIVDAVDVAARLGATPMQVALAWLLRRAPNILLIPAPRRSRTCARTSPRFQQRRIEQRQRDHVARRDRGFARLAELKADAAIHQRKRLHALHRIRHQPRIEIERGLRQHLLDQRAAGERGVAERERIGEAVAQP